MEEKKWCWVLGVPMPGSLRLGVAGNTYHWVGCSSLQSQQIGGDVRTPR